MKIRSQKQRLMGLIEEKRAMMYQSYENNVAYDELIKLSTELDHLLNQLELLNQKTNVKQNKII